jgi:hypothetical protein
MTNDKNMDNEVMLKLVNSLHSLIADWSCSGEECEYVYVPARDISVREVFRKCGFTDKEYEGNIIDGELIDLNLVGFRYGNWWDSKKGYGLKIKELKCKKSCTLIDYETKKELGICFTKDMTYNVTDQYATVILSVIDDLKEEHCIRTDDKWFKEYFDINE